MVRAWYMAELGKDADQRLEHQRNPPEFVDLPDLFQLTGVEYFKLDPLNYKTDGELDRIRKERDYSFEDEITCSRECLPDYETKLKNFFQEHLHTDEEIRFVVEGRGYFDVRDGQEQWIRIEVEAGDMIVIPAGIYHRFTLDVNNFIKAKRYFVGEPVWVPHNRPADSMECRKLYLQSLEKGFSAVEA